MEGMFGKQTKSTTDRVLLGRLIGWSRIKEDKVVKGDCFDQTSAKGIPDIARQM